MVPKDLMRIATCLYDGHRRIVREDGDALVLLPAAAGTCLRTILAEDRLGDLAGLPGIEVDRAAVEFLPPVTNPDKILCVGLNYRGHLAETGAALPKHPSIFVRFPSSQVGHGQPVVAPAISAELDYEGELAVIIGHAAWRVTAEQAMEHVAGYTCFAENSVRDYQEHARQVTAGKNFLHSGAIGPWLTTVDEVPEPAALYLITRLNGVVVQEESLSALIFDIRQLIAYISSFTQLLPGDIISTGTPDGVGFLRDPKLWLNPGDVVEIDIPGVGLLRNRVISEDGFMPGAIQ